MSTSIDSTIELSSYRQQLAIMVSKWLISIAAILTVINSLWLIWDPPWRTLTQNVILLAVILGGAWSLRVARQGMIRRSAQVFMSTGLFLCTALTITLAPGLVLYSFVGLSLFVLIGAFLETSRVAVIWSIAGVCCAFAALTLRVLWIAPETEFEAPILAGMYFFTAPTLLAFSRLGRTMSDLLDRTLKHQTAVAQENALLYGQAQHEIADRIKAQEALRESERQFRNVLETVDLIAITLDRKGRVVFCNDFVLALTGWTRDEVLGTSWVDRFVPPDAQANTADVIDRAMCRDENLAAHHDNDIVTRQGERRRISWNNIVSCDYEGNIVGLTSIGEDITQRLQAEQELGDRETFLVLLNEIARAALQAENPTDLLQVTGRSLVTLFEADGCLLILWDKDTQQRGTTASFGALQPDLARLASLPEDILIDKTMLDSASGVTAHQAANAPYLSPRLAGAMAGRPTLALPLIAAEHKLGAAVLFFPHGRQPAPRAIARAEQVARQIALAVNKVQLRAELTQHAERLEISLHVKETMLREVHHRVKNNLQVVSSLLSLQTGQQASMLALQMFRESQSRIRSIALVHEKLYRSPDVDQVNAADYVRDLVTSLFRTYTVHVGSVDLELAIEDLTLSIDTAVPFGLILNELVSNALKYAFPLDRQKHNGDRNKLFIGVRERQGRLELLVRDNGIGLPSDLDHRDTDSLGLQLVNTLAEQLEGTVEVERSQGTTFRLDLALIDSHEHL